MKMGSVAQDQHCMLLLDIYPAFVSALPPPSNLESVDGLVNPSEISNANLRGFLRHEIQTMGLCFKEQHANRKIPVDALKEVQNAIEQVLLLFEDLVECADGLNRSWSGYDHNLGDTFPNLVTLKYGGNSDLTSVRVSFGKPHDMKTCRRAFLTAQQFNGIMKRVYPEPVQQRDQSDRKQVDRRMTIEKVIEVSNVSKRICQNLESALCKNAGSHQGFLRLSDFEEREFEIQLSICGAPKLMWQQTFVCMESGKSDEKTFGQLCPELQRGRRLMTATRMRIKGDGFSQMVTELHGKRPPMKLWNTTLSQVLQQEEECRRIRPRYRDLKHNIKRELAVTIATALLHLFDSPLLHEKPLSGDRVYLVLGDTLGETKAPEAYATCLGTTPPDLHGPTMFGDDKDEDDSILALAAMLLELELEMKISPSAEDVDEFTDEPSLHVAVTRLLEDLEGNMDARFIDIVHNCVTLYANSASLKGPDYRTKMQAKLLEEVVLPLRERYKTLREGDRSRKNISLSHDQLLSPPPALYEKGLGDLRSPDQRNLEHLELSKAYSEPLFLESGGSTSEKWLKKIDRINHYAFHSQEQDDAHSRIRIAVLDTGCDAGDGCIVNLGEDGEARLTDRWLDCDGNAQQPIDEDEKKHGTSTVALLLRVAHHADVYVARVAKRRSDLRDRTDSVVRALRHAATLWNVDIITMSFGFESQIDPIAQVIHDIVGERRSKGRDILFFAAANNDGLNSKELFPASDANVIAVRGTDHTGAFVSEYNPNPWRTGFPLFGTLAKDVPYDRGNKNRCKSGCSIATPILVGIMATIMHYASCQSNDARVKKLLRTKNGIEAVMRHMGEPSPGTHRIYVAPWSFFSRNSQDRIALVRHALANLQPSRCH